MKVFTLKINDTQKAVLPVMAEQILASRKSVNAGARVAGISSGTYSRALIAATSAIRNSQGQLVLDELEMKGLLGLLYVGDLSAAMASLNRRLLGASDVVNNLLANWPADCN